MTSDTEAPAIILGIVACATCDNVYRAHEGRQTCPGCGGDPGYLIIDFSGQAPPATSEEGETETGDVAAPPAAEVTPPAEGPAPSGEPSTAAATGEGGPGVAEEAPREASSARRRRSS